MKVLVACERSGVVRDAFTRRGHQAVSCDLVASSKPGPHMIGSVLDHLNDGWDVMVGHPPCTYIANSGVRWLFDKNGNRMEFRWAQMVKAATFFKTLLECNIPKIALENPIPHHYAVEIIGRNYNSGPYQPWMFGHGETKATVFWLKNLPHLSPTNVVSGREDRIHKLWLTLGGEELQIARSETLPGFADAMALYWGAPQNSLLDEW